MPFWSSTPKTPVQTTTEPPVNPEEYAVLKSYILNSIAGWNKGLKAQTLYNQKMKGDTSSGAPRRKKLIKAALNDVANMPDIENYTASSAAANMGKTFYNSIFTKKSPVQGGKKTRKHRKKKH
jgi:hypothetical protein